MWETSAHVDGWKWTRSEFVIEYMLRLSQQCPSVKLSDDWETICFFIFGEIGCFFVFFFIRQSVFIRFSFSGGPFSSFEIAFFFLVFFLDVILSYTYALHLHRPFVVTVCKSCTFLKQKTQKKCKRFHVNHTEIFCRDGTRVFKRPKTSCTREKPTCKFFLFFFWKRDSCLHCFTMRVRLICPQSLKNVKVGQLNGSFLGRVKFRNKLWGGKIKWIRFLIKLVEFSVVSSP